MERIIELCEGNPGAATVLSRLSTIEPVKDHFDSYLNVLIHYGIKGSMVWILYKDICKSDISLFRNKLTEYALGKRVHEEDKQVFKQNGYETL